MYSAILYPNYGGCNLVFWNRHQVRDSLVIKQRVYRMYDVEVLIIYGCTKLNVLSHSVLLVTKISSIVKENFRASVLASTKTFS